MIIKEDVAKEGLFEVFGAVESMGVEHIADATVKSLDHAVCFRRSGSGQSMIDSQREAELIEFMLTGWLTRFSAK